MRALILPLLLAACVVTETEVAMPSALTGAEAIPITGANGGLTGRVTVGEAAGRYTRTRTETTTLGVYERDYATTRFTLAGGALGAGTDVNCEIKRRAVTVQGVSSPTLPTQYVCALSRGGSMRLDEQVEVAGPYPFPVRVGQVSLDGTVLSIRSLHAYEGIERESLSPIGYSFAEGDRVVGAVRMLMPPALRIAPEATERQRAAMMVAGAALALTWESEL